MRSLIKFSSCFVRVIYICWVLTLVSCMYGEKKSPFYGLSFHLYGILAKS